MQIQFVYIFPSNLTFFYLHYPCSISSNSWLTKRPSPIQETYFSHNLLLNVHKIFDYRETTNPKIGPFSWFAVKIVCVSVEKMVSSLPIHICGAVLPCKKTRVSRSFPAVRAQCFRDEGNYRTLYTVHTHRDCGCKF